jgi:hypothetical protein
MEQNEYPQPEEYCNCISTTVSEKVDPHIKHGWKVPYGLSDLLFIWKK